MIKGHVRFTENGGEPVIRIMVFGGYGSKTEVEAVVDTGFTGFLTLPRTVVESLSLIPSGDRGATFADGSIADIASYEADALWHEKRTVVTVLAMNAAALVGMELLRGSELRVRAVPDGGVEIEELT